MSKENNCTYIYECTAVTINGVCDILVDSLFNVRNT